MSMRRFMAGAAGGLVIALGAGHTSTLQAQGTSANQPADQQFVDRVAAGNLLEVRLSEIAQQKTSNAAVKQFADMMVVGHTTMQKQWMALASKNGLQFRAELTPDQLAQLERMRNLSGADFDRAYMGLMVQNHRDNVYAFENESSVSHSPAVKSLLTQDLAVIRNHLTMAQRTGSQVGVDTTSTVVTQTGQPTQPGQATQNVRADSAFISEVEAANTTELRLARMAEGRARDPQVKRFAQTMVTDYERMQKDWTALSSRNGIRVSASVSPLHQEQVTRLGKLSGTEFDRDYMAAMVQNHQQNLNAFQTRGRVTQSTEVRQLVQRSLPTLQQHLSQAQQVENQVRADTTTTIATPNPQDPQKNQDGATKADAKTDAEFVRNVGNHHFLQVQLGRLAQQKGRDAEVKRFGKEMEADHNALEKQLSNMASKNGMKFKSGMGPDNQANLDRLEKVASKDFDRAYMTLMIQTHNAYLNYWRKEGRSAQSAAIRQYVNAGLPTLEEHMDMAKRIGKRVGVDAEAALEGRRVATE